MPTFKFKEPNEARAGITEAQARRLGYVTKGPSNPKELSEKNKYWKIKHFGYEEAKLVASGKRRGDPNNPKSYWTGAYFLKDEQGRKVEVVDRQESRVKEIALRKAAEQVVRAKLGIEMDEVEPYEHRKHDLLVDHWQAWREGIKTDNPHESPKTSKAYHTTLRFLQIHYPEKPGPGCPWNPFGPSPWALPYASPLAPHGSMLGPTASRKKRSGQLHFNIELWGGKGEQSKSKN